MAGAERGCLNKEIEMAKERTLEQHLRDSKAEVKELRRMLDHKCEAVVKLEAEVKSAKDLRIALYDRCVQERTDYLSRLFAVDMRIHALGYIVPSLPGDPPART
jgi:hypothetical protein